MLFNYIVYKQKLGTVMGTKVAPTYTTLVLRFLEKLFETLEEKFVNTLVIIYVFV